MYVLLERQGDNFSRKTRHNDTHHFYGENSFVAVRQLVVERHDDAVGDDGDDDGPFEDGPVDKPGGEPSHRTGRRKEKEGGGPRVGHTLLFLAIGIGCGRSTHGKEGPGASSHSPDEAG